MSIFPFHLVKSSLEEFAPDEWEIFFQSSKRFLFQSDPVYRVIHQTNAQQGCLIRFKKKDRTGFAFTNYSDESALRVCVKKAIQSLDHPFNAFPRYPLSGIGIVRLSGKSADASKVRKTAEDLMHSDIFWYHEPHENVLCASRKIAYLETHWELMNSLQTQIECQETLWQCEGKWIVGQPEHQILVEDQAASREPNTLGPQWVETLRHLRKNFIVKKISADKSIESCYIILTPQTASDWLSMIYRQASAENRLIESSQPNPDSLVDWILDLVDDRTWPMIPGSAKVDKAGFPAGKKYFYISKKTTLIQDTKAQDLSQHQGFIERDDNLYPVVMPGNLQITPGQSDPEDHFPRIGKAIWVFRLLIPDASDYSGKAGFEGIFLNRGISQGYCKGIIGNGTWLDWCDHLQFRCRDLVVNRRIASPTLIFRDIPVQLL